MTVKNFIEAAMRDPEFWEAGGIPEKEAYYIKNLHMTEDEVSTFYTAMCTLQCLNRQIYLDGRTAKAVEYEADLMYDGKYSSGWTVQAHSYTEARKSVAEMMDRQPGDKEWHLVSLRRIK